MAAGLGKLGWGVDVHSLEGEFPAGDARAEASLGAALTSVPDGDTVLIDGLAMGALPGPVRAHAERVRVLGLVHHPLADETGLDERERVRLTELERQALSACAGVIVTSPFTAVRIEAFGVTHERVRAVLPGTDPARPAVGPGPGKPPRLLCVGTVIPRKGQDVLVRALARLKHVHWSCVCAGSLDRAPAYAKRAQALAREVGLADRISFPGECRDRTLEDLFHGASLFVLPSYYEGYGMALTEALARGLPVVSTTGGAVPHTVPASAGILLPPGDDAALGDALGHLLAGPAGAARRATLASAARQHALKLPSWERAAATMAKAVLELAKRPGPVA
ncbi:MAG: glycosyltransferase [Gemmatimonadetes bacterium]|nr:glycosyltransferase [Gemmatimonadota bacterium]